ncbi:hydroxyisourate hydrolase [Rhodococcus antarcticus]|uniref:5-hydroxyisourate hydrolase n=1 Tax=Rhodococcus antarcticus TaxID=2987751 RepID=A0ABY6NXU6_9NOCA|nr:hydroxyisourate hydrolase [Rhodococcus antarcticus]UZJ24212.1 hydroxyisourate hydrolase [Rhodococcus antarcticus]
MSGPGLVTTHVLDAALGRPAAGVPVRLESTDGTVGTSTTDVDGRARDLAPDVLAPGTYRLFFDTAAYHAASGQPSFYPEVCVTFTISDPEQHLHVPLLLSPFAYSTYRGS